MTSPRAREWAAGIPRFDAWASSTLARHRGAIGATVGGAVVVLLVWQQLLFWAGLVAALFAAGFLAPRLQRVRAWALWLAVRLRGSQETQWSAPAQDSDHEYARSQWDATRDALLTVSQAAEGDERAKRRELIYYLAELLDGLTIRGDRPLHIKTRSQRAASAPAPLGFVGTAAVARAPWRLIVTGLLAAVAALLYARGEVLEAQRDRATTSLAASEAALAAERNARMAAEANAQQWQERLDGDVRAALEQTRQTREFLTEQQARQQRLANRRAARNETSDSTGSVDLTGSLRDLAAPAFAVPDLPAAAPSSDTAGRVSD